MDQDEFEPLPRACIRDFVIAALSLGGIYDASGNSIHT